MFIPRIHVSAHVQQRQQAGQPLWLLAGQIQRTALVDLQSDIYIIYVKLIEDRGDAIRTDI